MTMHKVTLAAACQHSLEGLPANTCTMIALTSLNNVSLQLRGIHRDLKDRKQGKKAVADSLLGLHEVVPMIVLTCCLPMNLGTLYLPSSNRNNAEAVEAF